MAISNRSLTCRGFAAAFLFLAPAWPLLGQQQQGLPPAGTPDVPPPITVVTTTPGDPGDPGNPPGTPGGPGGPGGNPTPTVTTPAPSEPKDMKDMKDMKSSITYHTTPNDYFSIFLSGSGTHGDMGNSTDPGHYYYDRAQGNLGVEYHFAGDWTIGTILSYAHIDSAFGNFDASSTVDSYLPSLSVSYSHEGWWAYLSTTDGYDTFTEDRGTVNGTAHGAGDGWQYGGKLVGGYLFHSGPWSYGPVGDLHGYQLNASGFTESGAGASDLHFNSEGTYTLQSQFGGLVRYDTEFLGASVQPYFSASWQREWGNANEAITGNTSGGASFSTRSVYLDRDAALLDLGVRASVSTDVGVFLGWEGVVGGNYLTNTAEGGVDISF